MIKKSAHNPAVSANLTDRVTMLLREDIVGGKYKAGSQLPAGKDLSTAFGVSITVIREALSRLKSDGLVVSRQGKGVFVGSALARTFRMDTSANESILQDTFELRIAVEVHAASLAAKRRKASDLKAMAKWLKEMEPGRRFFEQALAADISFHLAVAKATQNSLIVSFMQFLQPHLYEAIASARTISSKSNDAEILAYGDHVAIYEAIEDADSRRAAMATREVLEGSLRRLSSEIVRPRAGRGASSLDVAGTMSVFEK